MDPHNLVVCFHYKLLASLIEILLPPYIHTFLINGTGSWLKAERRTNDVPLLPASSGGPDHKFRNQMKPETFEALHILKSCYKDGLIKAEDEVIDQECKPFVPVDDD